METNGAFHPSPPGSLQWLENEFQPSSFDLETIPHTLQKRQSLRLRPSQILENAEPPSPLNMSSKSAPPPLTSRMSLLNLLSRPNVERARSYAEPGIDVAPKSELVIHVQSEKSAPKPASILSGKTTATKWTKFKPRSRQAPWQPKERKTGSFEPPPLFQAYPQSMKDGTLEVSSISVETLNKAKSKGDGLNATLGEKAAGDTSSAEARRNSALRYIANGSAGSVELPKKIFVLVTSGYLLQYAEKGLSDRLPEKVLHLGKDSAAFACDLVPGKHYVLQVSQAVDQDGIIVANSGSILARLGIRSAAAKRMASNLVLVLPNAEEMESWMLALRQEIEAMGGKKIRHYTVRPGTKDAGASATDLKKTPSQSHRYRVKRNPSQVSSVTSPKPYQTSFPPVLPDINLETSDRTSLDDIEIDADLLNHYFDKPVESVEVPVELSALPSPPAIVVEEPKLEKFNDLPNENVYISPAKQTVAAPTWRVRTSSRSDISSVAANSVQTTPGPSQGSESLSETSDVTLNNAKPTPVSYNFSRKSPPPPLNLHSQTASVKRPLFDESPIIPNYPMLSPRMSTRLTNAYTERNFPDGIPMKQKHDSKMSNTLPTAAVDGIEDEVQKSVENLPKPKDSASRSSTGTLTYQAAAANAGADRARKVASFSMPLKVNPTAIHGPSSSGNIRRHSRMDEVGILGEEKVGYAISPPVEPTETDSGANSQAVTPSPPTAAHKQPPSNSTPVRLSLFPSPRPSPSITPFEYPKRSPSSSSRQSYIQPVTNGGPLRRPTSLQVRSDPAPFLTSVRNSTGSTETRTSATTVPIRGMKPSRSASNVAALAKPQSSPLEEFKALRFDTPTLEEEDLAMPLRVENSATTTTKPKSRNSVRKSLKGRSSLPDLDFGVPIVGLGPPAPPPQAPLPAPPPSSRTTSPTPLHQDKGSIDTVGGLGISVS